MRGRQHRAGENTSARTYKHHAVCVGVNIVQVRTRQHARQYTDQLSLKSDVNQRSLDKSEYPGRIITVDQVHRSGGARITRQASQYPGAKIGTLE